MASQLQQASGAAASDPPLAASGDAGAAPHEDGGGAAAAPQLRNRAGDSSSPYVRVHADTPVAWQLLDDEAVDRARRGNKLIFMHIGFRACHYCRLTTQDSFSNKTVASILNESFVPVIIDREERPDIDFIYMNYIQAVNSAGGWPLNLFLTPELEPVFGGTYWPGPGADHPDTGGAGGSDAGEEEKLDFLTILRKLQKVWQEQEPRCRAEAKEILSQLRSFAAEGTLGAQGTSMAPGIGAMSTAVLADSAGSTTAGIAIGATAGEASAMAASSTSGLTSDLDLDLDQLEEAYMNIARSFDPVNGGFGMAPKFPTPARLSLLLRLAQFPEAVQDVIGTEEVAHATHMALHTLRRVRDGALHDHVGAGFARYSVTEDWNMPHFEKMVADNALLLNVYLDAWLCVAGDKLSRDDEFADVVFELADYLTSPPICQESGGFAASEAADSFFKRGDRHIHEGAYYLWTRREFDAVVDGVGSEGQHASTVAAAHWNVLEHGNIPRDLDPNDEFINQNVLWVTKDAAELGRQFGIPIDEVKRLVLSAREKLRLHRERERVRPEIDDKVVVSFNGMVISALARVGGAVKAAAVDGEKGMRYVDAAVKAARFIKENLWDAQDKVLYRTYHGSRGSVEGLAEDYAFLIEGLLDLYEVTESDAWLEWAEQLQDTQVRLFYDTPSKENTSTNPLVGRSHSGAFYNTAEAAPHTILRLKDGMDTSQPSTNAVSASNLFRLGALLGDRQLTARARETITAFEVEMLQYPWLFVGLLSGVVAARLGGAQAVVAPMSSSEGVVADAAREKVVQGFLTAPRAGLRTLAYVRPGEDSWLLRRHPALGREVRDGAGASGGAASS